MRLGIGLRIPCLCLRIALLWLHAGILLRVPSLGLRIALRSGRIRLRLRIPRLCLRIALLLHRICLPGIAGLRRIARLQIAGLWIGLLRATLPGLRTGTRSPADDIGKTVQRPDDRTLHELPDHSLQAAGLRRLLCSDHGALCQLAQYPLDAASLALLLLVILLRIALLRVALLRVGLLCNEPGCGYVTRRAAGQAGAKPIAQGRKDGRTGYLGNAAPNGAWLEFR